MGAAAFGRRPHVGNNYGIFVKRTPTFSIVSFVLKCPQTFAQVLNSSQFVSIFLNYSQIFSHFV